MITDRLKTETRPYHDNMERVGFSDKIMNGSLNLEEYKLLIRNNYIMNSIIEKAVSALPEFVNLKELNFEGRKKNHLLERDLDVLGLNKAELDALDYSMSFDNLSQALGAFYVMEGSTLGGSVISRHLAKNPNLASVPEYNFYGCYGDMVGPNWKMFQGVLISHADSTEKEDQMVQAACDTFDYFRGIFEDSLSKS